MIARTLTDGEREILAELEADARDDEWYGDDDEREPAPEPCETPGCVRLAYTVHNDQLLCWRCYQIAAPARLDDDGDDLADVPFLEDGGPF